MKVAVPFVVAVIVARVEFSLEFPRPLDDPTFPGPHRNTRPVAFGAMFASAKPTVRYSRGQRRPVD